MDNKKKGIGIFIAAILVISVFAAMPFSASAASQEEIDKATDDVGAGGAELTEAQKLAAIQNAIEEKGATWTAGETSVSGLSVEEKRMLCGAKIGPIPEDVAVLSPPEGVGMAIGTFDWRDKDGQNWVTSVKNQSHPKSCGSCWVFGSTGAFEAQINIDAGDPTIDFDSSEQNVLSCSGGGDCTGGWPHLALGYIRNNCVPDEACLPYQADDTIPCSDTCSGWSSRAWTFENFGIPVPNTTDTYKWALETYGPMVVVLNVSEDLFSYTGGIYEPVWTSEEFGQMDHCVMLVGYNDTEGYWIIKNSWGPNWGEEGYGAVYYGHLEQYDYAFVMWNTKSCIQKAIDDGIAWLVAQQNPDGSWGTSDMVGRTGLAVKKLEHHAVDCKYGYCLDSPFNETYPYADNVSRGLDYIFANAYIMDISVQPAGDPDTNGNDIGVYFVDGNDPHHRNYETGIALMAIAESTTPDKIVDVPGSEVNGWTYYDVAVDTMNYIAYGQNDAGNARGGWGYSENSGWSCNSNTGWVVLGLQYAETEDPLQGFNIPIPQFVKNELNIWIDYIQNDPGPADDGWEDDPDGGSGYTAPDDWVNILKTGNLLKQMAFVGDTNDTQRVINANDYICRHWMDDNDDPGWRPNNYHAMYTTMKGFVSLDIHETCGHDWQADYEDAIVAQQNADGSWSGCEWGDPILCTEWALLTLQKAAPPPRPTPPPAAVPAMTPIGLIALIGLLSVIAAISIRTSIRKKRR